MRYFSTVYPDAEYPSTLRRGDGVPTRQPGQAWTSRQCTSGRPGFPDEIIETGRSAEARNARYCGCEAAELHRRCLFSFIPVKKIYPPGPLSGKSQKGFTLIEAVMVIILIGIMAVLAIPRFKAMYGIKLEAAGKSVISHIQYVQNAGVTRHTDTKIVFDLAIDKYEAFYFDDTSSTWYPLGDPIASGNLIMDFQTDYQYKGIDITSADFNGGTTLQFNWEGIPRDGSNNPLTAQGIVTMSYKNNTINIQITPNTGKITAQ